MPIIEASLDILFVKEICIFYFCLFTPVLGQISNHRMTCPIINHCQGMISCPGLCHSFTFPVDVLLLGSNIIRYALEFTKWGLMKALGVFYC